MVANELQTSRVPVREALRQPESEGLVLLKAHTGAWVAQFEFNECTEVYKLRKRIGHWPSWTAF